MKQLWVTIKLDNIDDSVYEERFVCGVDPVGLSDDQDYMDLKRQPVTHMVEHSALEAANNRIKQLETDNALLTETLKRSAHDTVEYDDAIKTIAHFRLKIAKLENAKEEAIGLITTIKTEIQGFFDKRGFDQ